MVRVSLLSVYGLSASYHIHEKVISYTEPNLIFVYFGSRKRYRDSGNNQHVHTHQTVCT